MPPNEKRFDPQRQHRLLSAERHAYWNPPQFLARFNLGIGQVALDVGSGPGFWTLPLADLVGATGQVWAVDVSQELLDALAARNPPPQVRFKRSELPVIDLPRAVADFAWLAFVFHEVEPPETLAQELRRVLRATSRVAVLEWRPDAQTDQGPPRSDRVTPEQVNGWLTTAGFTRVQMTWQDPDNYLVEATA
jgi:ubiquinone/menaquinone biosynthesis C-methylase UbiE